MIIGDPDPPVARRRLTAYRNIAAQADEYAAAEPVGHLLCAPVRCPRLGRSGQVDLDAMVKPGPAAFAVQVHVAPAGQRADGAGQPGRAVAGRLDVGEVPVVSEPGQDTPARRVYVTAGQLGCSQRGGQQLGEHLADGDRLSAGRVEPGKLGVWPE